MLVLALGIVTGACERRDWKKTSHADTLEAYQAYVKEYPQGKHAEEAWRAIETLRLRETLASNTVAGYEKFLQEFPGSAARQTVVINLMRLLEPKAQALTPEQMDRMIAELDTSFGIIRFRFYALDAPETCRNFIKLAWAHFYEHVLFLQVVPGQLIQTGAPHEDPRGGPGYTIKAEFNSHLHVPGAVAMHRELQPDSAGSQFYICLSDLPERDYQYTVFGQVIEGMEVVNRIGEVETSGPEGKPSPFRPVENIFLHRVNILEPSSSP